MKTIEFKSPVKLGPAAAVTISRYADKLNDRFYIQKSDKDRAACLNSLIGLLSLGVKKGDSIKIWVTDNGPVAETKLLSMKREFESLK